jgi:hypothetical protein
MKRHFSLGKMFTLAFMIVWGAHASTAWCMVLKAPSVRTKVAPNARLVPTVPGNNLSSLNNPALLGGISLSGLTGVTPATLNANAPALQPAAAVLRSGAQAASVLPQAAAPVALRPAPSAIAAHAALAPLTQAAAGTAAKPGVAASARSFAANLSKGGNVANQSRAFFDGHLKASDEDSSVDASAADFESFGPRSKLARLAEANDTLSQLYPRVVLVYDSFENEVPEATVGLIEKLLANNVHVVFMTPRPAKGENSAAAILGSKIKSRTGNPLIIASYNGANIIARNSNAENPTPVVPNLPAFAEGTIEKFQEITAQLRTEFGFRLKVREFGFPDDAESLVYGGELPNKTADATAWAKAYNKALRAAGLTHRVEMGVSAEGRPHFFIQSTEMHLNMDRVMTSLETRFPDLIGNLDPSQVLILGDTKKAGRAIKALPGKGYHIYNAPNEAELHDAFASVLGKKSYQQIRVTRSKIRSFLAWENKKANRRSGGSGGVSSNAKTKSARKKTGSMHRNLAFYRGIIVYNLMPKLYRLIRKGQYDQATLEAAYDLLNRMWYNPMSEWVRINDELEAARRSPIWKSLQKGYLESVKVWLANYYRRNFPDYPRNLGEQVIGKLINTHMDIGNGISLGYSSPYTNSRYIVKVLPNRVLLEYDDQGPILVAHVDRSGREPYTQEFQESLETSLVGRATLKGYGERRADGEWYVNDEANPRVKVIYHYNTRSLAHTFTASELEANAVETTALIDRMQADAEFLAYFEEQEAANRKLTDAAKKRRREQAEQKKHAADKKRRASRRNASSKKSKKKGN